MLNEVMTWLAQQNPGWIFLIFPGMVAFGFLSAWRSHRKQMKLESNPINMDENEYIRFNNKRMNK